MPRFTQHPKLSPKLAKIFREQHREIFDQAHFISTNNDQVVKSFDLEAQSFIIKRYPEKGPRANLRSLLGISRAMNSFTKSAELATYEIPSPPHLFVARHLGVLSGMSYLIMEKSAGVQLTTQIDSHPHPPFPESLFAILIEMTNRIHQAGLTHGDFHAANIFVLPGNTLEFIDLDNMKPNRRRQQKDRARLLRSFDAHPDLQEKLSHALQQNR